ncbi:MAG: uroporphyrinogen-III C-methyltransferase [Alphaproteobacteria bacterium]|nr:uroporphyrinogen-III C-methyltransferase [Alphaproteobacteria bacterium]
MTPLAVFEPGTVWLAGAGPGDPGLLTLLAAKGLAEADVILYDALVDEAVLAMASPKAQLEFVGKRAGVKSLKQPEITARMVQHARAGKKVLRLKGGDPFVFGRGGEEAIALAQARIPFRIIPGVTAGIGGLAYASIPATHRDINNVVSFVTGRDSTGELPGNIDWDALATSSPVIVFYMALKTMPEIAQKLIKAGRAPSTPLAVISNATAASQDVVETTLGECAATLSQTEPGRPAIIAIGESVKIRGLLKGFQQTISESPDVIKAEETAP